MPAPAIIRAFRLFWWTLGAVLCFLSVQTTVAGLAVRHRDPHAVVIGVLEAIAAALFLVPRTMRAGAFGLLAVIGVAFVIHAIEGQFAATLLIFAAGVYFVLVHGPVPPVASRQSDA